MWSMDRLFFVAVVGFFVGVGVYSFLPLSWFGILVAGIIGAACFCVGALRKSVVYGLCVVFCIGACLGMGRVLLAPAQIPDPFVSLFETEVSFTGVVVAEPDIREVTQRLTVEVAHENETTRVLVVAPVYPSVSYGERVTFSGVFEKPESFSVGEGRVFAYDKFLAKDAIFSVVQNAQVEVVASREGIVADVFGAFTDVKQAGLEALSRALPEPHASLAGGLILGGKQGLGETLLQNFIVVGLVHIVVLSGYNVMIVAEFILRVLGFLSRRTAVIVAAVTIGVFVLIAGAGAASIRAGIMAAIALFARATGRTYDAFRALILAAVLMVLVNPYTIVFDLGFQLSFIATLGLIFGVPIVIEKLTFVKNELLREIVATTIAAQIAVLPLLLYHNGLFSFVSLPANILVLPLVPLAMLASLLALIAGLIVPMLAPFVSLPAYVLLSYIVAVAEVGSALPLASVTIPAFPFMLVIVAYVYLIYVVAKKKPR